MMKVCVKEDTIVYYFTTILSLEPRIEYSNDTPNITGVTFTGEFAVYGCINETATVYRIRRNGAPVSSELSMISYGDYIHITSF